MQLISASVMMGPLWIWKFHGTDLYCPKYFMEVLNRVLNQLCESDELIKRNTFLNPMHHLLFEDDNIFNFCLL